MAASAFYRHDRRGVVAAFAYLLFSASYDAGEMLAVNCELVMMLPLAWAIVLARDDSGHSHGRMLGVGILIGLASLVKYQAVLWVPAVVVAVAFTPRGGWKDALRALAVYPTDYLVVPRALACSARRRHRRILLLERHAQHQHVLNPTTTGEAIERGARQFIPFLGVTSVLWFASRDRASSTVTLLEGSHCGTDRHVARRGVDRTSVLPALLRAALRPARDWCGTVDRESLTWPLTTPA
jgi:4-amino-4-deoxy-L-arabinose transferase-like glycosyltransferase